MLSRLILGLLGLLTTTSCTGVWAETPIAFCTYEISPYTSCIDGWYVDDVPYQCYDNRTAVIQAVNSCQCDAGVGLFRGAIDNVTVVHQAFGTTYVLVTQRHDTRQAMWTVFSPFQPSLWVLVMITPLAVAIVMTYFSWTISRYKKKRFDVSVLPQYAFQNTLALLNDYTNVDYRLDWTGKKRYMIVLKFFLQTMLVSYAFLCLVITSVYTAQLTNILFMSTMADESDMFLDELAHGNNAIILPRDLASLLPVASGAVLYDVDTPGVLDAIQRVVEDLSHPAVVAPLEAAVWAIGEVGDPCRVSLRLVRGVTTDVTTIVSPCVNAYAVVARLSKMTMARVARMNSFLRTFTKRRTACAENMPRIGIRDISGGWIIVAISIAIPLALTVGRYLFFLGRKCVTEYGHMFVLPFSSSSDGSSNHSNDCYETSKTQEIKLTQEELKKLAECGGCIHVIAQPHLDRASSPPSSK